MDKVQFGERIKLIRLKKGLTQEEFGKLIDNATKSMVSKWERGETSPSSKRQSKLVELGNEVGVDLFTTNVSINLKDAIEVEFLRVYYKYLKLQTKELGDRFERVAIYVDKEKVKEDVIQCMLTQDTNRQSYTTMELKDILYKTIDKVFKNELRHYPSTDRHILEYVTKEIKKIDKTLKSYYYKDDGNEYQIEGQKVEMYEQMKNILEFTLFQLKHLKDE